ncbi:MAG: pilus assembly protein TadG-related protein [Telluria sp.]|nr:pilus assembly protein TadG-related protein [Telluria sp.]
MKRLRIMRRQRRGEAGSYAVAFAMLLIPLIGFIGMALDLSLAYTRSTELQSVADAAAIAAARELDGTPAGVTNAKDRAQAAAQANKYQFASPIAWSSNALELSDTPDGPWISADSVGATDAPAIRYAKVDTADLAGAPGVVKTLFMRVLGGAPADFLLSARAIAGRSTAQITPLAICALNNNPTAARANTLGAGFEELLEYGFRRGFSYNLLKLNPNGSSAKNYLVNPIDFPGGADNSDHHSVATARPFVCNGTMAAPRLTSGSTVYVSEPFPAELARELNSRFDDYSGGSTCDTAQAPPDFNVRRFIGGYSGWWMNTTPAMGIISGSAETFEKDGNMLTIGEADPLTTPVTVNSYGPLWSFSKPVRFSGGLAFLKANWPALYPISGAGSLSSSYSDTSLSPYNRGVPPHAQLPTNTGLRTRRILNIPLLSCPVTGGSTAVVLAIGRFLMTAPASAAVPAIHAEFGGLVSDGALAVSAVLYK